MALISTLIIVRAAAPLNKGGFFSRLHLIGCCGLLAQVELGAAISIIFSGQPDNNTNLINNKLIKMRNLFSELSERSGDACCDAMP